MNHYNIVLEIEIDADSPLEAATKVQEWAREQDTALMYYVQHSASQDIFSVDLSEDDKDAVVEIDNYIPLIR